MTLNTSRIEGATTIQVSTPAESRTDANPDAARIPVGGGAIHPIDLDLQ